MKISVIFLPKIFYGLLTLFIFNGCAGGGNTRDDYFSSLILQQPLTEIKPELMNGGEEYLIPVTAVYGSEENKSVICLLEDNGLIFLKSKKIKIIRQVDSSVVASNLIPGERILSNRIETINYLQRIIPGTLKKRFTKTEPTILRHSPPG